MTDDPNWKGLAAISVPAFTPHNWGTTPAAIESSFAFNFLYAIEVNSAAGLNAAITAAGPFTIARLSTELKALDTSGQTYWILRYMMPKVSPANMQVLHAAFGDAAFTPILPYMPAAVRAAYKPVTPLPYSQAAALTGQTAMPPYNLTQRHLYDVYLLQLFSGADSANVALHKASLYAQVRIKAGIIETVAAVVGITVGVIEIYKFTQSTEYQTLQDWLYFKSINPAWDSGKRVTVVPDMTLTWPTLPDPGMPDFPAVDGGGYGGGGSAGSAGGDDALFEND